MDMWKILAGASVFLVLWAGLVTLLGHSLGAAEIAVGMVFAMFGLYLGNVISERLVGEYDD